MEEIAAIPVDVRLAHIGRLFARPDSGHPFITRTP